MEKELEDMDTTNPFVKDLHQEIVESVKVSLEHFVGFRLKIFIKFKL